MAHVYEVKLSSVTHEMFLGRMVGGVYAHKENRIFFEDNNLTEAKLWCDTTYAFALTNMLGRIENNLGKTNPHYEKLKKEFRDNYLVFMKNPYLLWKQKLLLTLALIKYL